MIMVNEGNLFPLEKMCILVALSNGWELTKPDEFDFITGLKQNRCVLITIFNIALEKAILSAQDKNLGTSIGATQIDVVSFVDYPEPDRGSKKIIVVQIIRTVKRDYKIDRSTIKWGGKYEIGNHLPRIECINDD